MLRNDGSDRQAPSTFSSASVWPHEPWPQPISVLGTTSLFGVVKTLFLLSIDPTRTLIYDTEGGSSSYQSLGFTRVDVPAEMLALFPGGYKPSDTFTWWLAHVRNIPPHKYKVIMLDTVSEIEAGLVEYVRANPHSFGHTASQYAKMSGLMWGDVKDYC